MLMLGILCLILFLLVCALIIKIILMYRAMDEICNELNQKLSMDTNTIISVNSRDSHIRRIASRLNIELKTLRKEQQRLHNGNIELKNAVTNIAHDLRTPLTAICGYLDLLEQEQKSEAVQQYLEIISGRVQALKVLTEELFRYSVISSTSEELTKEAVNIGGVLEEAVAAHYAALSEKGIVPEITIPDGNVIRQLNRAALLRIFANLLSNAIKYSDGDLKISLSEKGEIVFANHASKLDNLEVEKLFDRFYTVESAYESTGLGLSIAKLLTERMNGKINANYQNGSLYISIIFPISNT